jgi:hypothetical protein
MRSKLPWTMIGDLGAMSIRRLKIADTDDWNIVVIGAQSPTENLRHYRPASHGEESL